MAKHQVARKPQPKARRGTRQDMNEIDPRFGRPYGETSNDQAYVAPTKFRRPDPLEAMTQKQADYIDAIENATVIFGAGPAGTGKTFVAGAKAVDLFTQKSLGYERIVITRPAVEAGEKLGSLPGEKEEKYEPYIAPFRSVLDERMGKGAVDCQLKLGNLIGAPFAYMRGHTFKNCIVILDEAQNATKEQMKLFLTRVGENCKVIVNGDETQSDIRNSGFYDAISRLSHIPYVSVIRFTRDDIVRSRFCAEVVQAYEEPLQA